jgi:hypothetical protein
MTMQPLVKSIKQLTCGNGRSIAVHPAILLTPTSENTDDTSLVQPPFNSTTIFDRLAITNALKLTNASCINENPVR